MALTHAGNGFSRLDTPDLDSPQTVTATVPGIYDKGAMVDPKANGFDMAAAGNLFDMAMLQRGTSPQESVTNSSPATVSDHDRLVPTPALSLDKPSAARIVLSHHIKHLPALGADKTAGRVLVAAAWAAVVSQLENSSHVVFQLCMDATAHVTASIQLELHADTSVTSLIQIVEDRMTAVEDGRVKLEPSSGLNTLLIINHGNDAADINHGFITDGQQEQFNSYGLVLSVHLGDQMSVSACFDEQVLETWTAKSLLERLGHVMHQFSQAGGEQPLSQVEMASQDLEQIWKWNAVVPRTVERCVHDIIQDSLRQHADALAIDAWDGQLSYAQLHQLAWALADRLVQLGVGPGSFVPLCFEKSLWTSVAVLAVAKAGGAFVLLDPWQPEQRLETIVEQVQGQLILASPSMQGLASRLSRNVLAIDWRFFKHVAQQDASCHTASPVLPSSILYVIFTSGSTGKPKGVVISHANAASALSYQVQSVGLTADTRLYDFSSYSFDVSINSLFTVLVAGGCLCVPSETGRRDDLTKSINDLDANWLDLTPSIVRNLWPHQLPKVRCITLGGEALRATDVERFWGKVRICNAYGPSECTPTSTGNYYASSLEALPRIGKGLGVVTWVTSPDDHNTLVPPGCIGELLIEGPLVGRGYLGDSARTAAAFIEDPPWLVRGMPGVQPGRRARLYKTGDLVRYHDDGSLTYIGRKDAQVKIRGQRVELGDVEHHLAMCLPWAQGVAAEVLAFEGRQTLAAFVVTPHSSSQQTQPTYASLSLSADEERLLASRLPEYMVPTLYLGLAKMPVNSAGKTDRNELRALGIQALDNMALDVDDNVSCNSNANPGQDAAELALRCIWARVLNVDASRVGSQVSFFRLGGDSITAMQVSAAARACGMDISTADILRQKTIAALAATAKQHVVSSARQHQHHDYDGCQFQSSPMQQLYLSFEPEPTRCYDQCFLLRLRRPLALDALQRALDTIVSRHAMLRARFTQAANGQWTQHIVARQDAASCFSVCQPPPASDVAHTIRNCRQSLDILNGPLLAAALVLTSKEHEKPAQSLFIAIHHLVIDLVSWRVLFQELEELITTGKVLLPPPSISFPAWSTMQAAYAKDKLSLDTSQDAPTPLLSYWGMDAASNVDGATASIQFDVDEQSSSALLGPANQAFHTKPVELLIASLIHSFANTFPDRPVPAIFNEGHGREPWDDQIDVSRTMGWFTTMYPVHVPAVDFLDAVRRTKDRVRGLAKNGWCYFTSRFAHANHAAASASHFPLEVVLNFAGSYQQLERDDSIFELVPLPNNCRPASAAGLRRFELFEVHVQVNRGQLAVSLLYPKYAHHQDRIAAWMDCYKATLTQAASILSRVPGQWTLADFPLAFSSYDSIHQFQTRLLPELGITDPEQVEDVFPCTGMQQGILLAQAKDSTHYRSALSFDIRTTRPEHRISFDRIEDAWRAVVRRHSLLRAILTDTVPGTGRTMHVVLANPVPGMTFLTTANNRASHTGVGYKKHQLQHHMTVVRIDDTRVQVQLEINHAIVDGYSDGIILHDFWQAYTGSLGPQGPLFRDYVGLVEQQQSETSATDFWASHLDSVQPCLFPLSKAGKEQMKEFYVAVEGLDVAKIHAFCASHELTTASIVQVAWALVLRQYTASTSPCFGNMTSSRGMAIKDIGDMIGPLIGMTPCHIRLDTELSIMETLRQVHAHHLDSLPYQAHSLLDIQQHLKNGRQPLFNTIMSIQKERRVLLSSADGHVLDEGPMVDPVEYEVGVSVDDGDQNLSIKLAFHAGVLGGQEAERVARTLAAAISLIVSDPHAKMSSASPVHHDDLEQLWCNNSAVPEAAEQCVHEVIEAVAQSQPDAQAVCAWDGDLTYGQLMHLASVLAKRLISVGVGPGTTVPLCFEKSKWTTVAILGVVQTGAAFVLIDVALPEQRLASIVQQVQASLVLSSPAQEQLALRLCSHVVVISHGFFAETSQKTAMTLPRVDLDSLMYFIFTSGTTGAPKGAMVIHRAFASAVKHQMQPYGFTKKSRVYDFSTYSFDAAIISVFNVLATGGCLCVPTDHDRMTNLEMSLNSMKATAVVLTPSLAKLLSPEQLPHLEAMILAGEKLRARDIEPWGGRAFAVYGPSECTPVSLLNPHPTSPELAVCLGKGFGVVTWIVDPQDHNRLLPPGCTGELLLEGPLVGAGYVGNQEKTAAAFIRDPTWLVEGAPGRPGRRGRLYKTGDLVCLDDDGNLWFLERKDMQVKIRGQRVELAEIEHWARIYMPEAIHVVVEVVESEQKGLSAFIALFLQMAPETGDSVKVLAVPARLRAKLAEHLPSYMVPTVIFSLQIPTTVSGKTDRKRLREIGASFSPDELAQARTAGTEAKQQPVSKMEQRLQDIWARVLNMEASRIGIQDSFFHLGGDSIAAIKAVGAARNEGFKLSVTDILRHQTLHKIASHCCKGMADEAVPFVPFSLVGDEFDAANIASHYRFDGAAIVDAYPCTPLQEGLMTLTLMRDASYMTQNVLELADHVQVDKLCAAWEHVAGALPILRTRIVQHSHLSLNQIVLDDKISWTRATGLQSHLDADGQQWMQLGEPLIRFALVSNEAGTVKWLVWTVHHALYDGWSMPLVIDAVYQAYQGKRLDGEFPPFQAFIEYIKSQDEQALSSYWQEALADYQATPFPPLPPSLEQQLAPTSVLQHSLTLPAAKSARATASTLLRAAWAFVVARMTDSDDVVFGATVSGRSAPVAGLDRMPAPTIATVPLRLRVRGSQTVADYLTSVQQQATDMIPFEQAGLQRIAKISPAASKACMFQTLLVIQPEDSIIGAGPLGSWLDSSQPQFVDTYALTLELRLGANRGAASVMFDSRVITPWQVQTLLQRLDFVLEQFGNASPSKTLSSVSLMTPHDLASIWQFNATVPLPATQSVGQMITERVQAQPDAPAVCAWDGDLTYSELNTLATRLAGLLVDHGVGSQVPLVPLCFEKSMWTTVAILSVVKAGAAFILLDPSLPEQRLLSIVQQVKGSLILTCPSAKALSSRLANQTITLNSSLFADLPDKGGQHMPEPSLSSLLYIIFTSGSTGTPKGVEVTHLNAASALLHQTHRIGFTPESRVFDFASYSFDVAISNVFSALTSGACLCVPSDQDRQANLEQSIASLRANVLDITPTVSHILSPANMPLVKTIILSGEALRAADVEKWWQAQVRLVHAYGPSECTPTSTLNYSASSPQDVVSIGKGVGVVTWVVSPESHDKLVPLGSVGELLLEGPLVGCGYLGDAKRTAAAFIDDPSWLLQGAPGHAGRHGRLYKTGDLVRYNQDGDLVFVGRKDTQTKIRGQRVELEEIEHHVGRCVSGVRQVVAEIVTPDDHASPVVVVFVDMSDEARTEERECGEPSIMRIAPGVQRQLADHLPSYMMPALFLSMAELPMTATGKTDRKRLRETGRNFLTAGAKPPSLSLLVGDGETITKTEQPAYALAQRVFSMLPRWRRQSLPSRDASGFENVLLQPCGLDSINMMSLIHHVLREFGVKLSLEFLLDRTTSIRTLAKSVLNLQQAQTQTGTLPAHYSPGVDIMAQIEKHDFAVAAVQKKAAFAQPYTNGNGTSGQRPLTVLLTGANGFIGSQILRQLLESNKICQVVAVVRGETQDAARSRTISAAKTALWWTDEHADKLQVWAGDLSLGQLGLEARQWDLFADQKSFDIVIHNGAEVHWCKNYASLEAANVKSTVELLRTVVAAPRMKLVYVSGGRDGEDEDEDESLVAQELGGPGAIGYSQTKFVAETVVKRAATRCPVNSKRLSIVTPGLVVGTPTEGVPNADDYLWRLAASCIRVAMYNADEADTWLAVSDVAALAGMIVGTALDPDAVPETKRRVKDGMKWRDFWAILRGLGYQLQPSPVTQWLAAVQEDIEAAGETHPLWPLKHLVEEESLMQNNETSNSSRGGETPHMLRVAVKKSAEFLCKCGFFEPVPLADGQGALQKNGVSCRPFTRSKNKEA
ncbi:hypothetical protein CDD82_813 [Ophiocordyceps australis]|uniref:Carrier domain-containing protein n=1 Tax=Ophiocordyceps australis TaxID=1399860 RepID=A0A2C5ZNL3_9HYPO|nr:hypothetical protein CDD82_813 [Ophiocordyceps australis]